MVSFRLQLADDYQRNDDFVLGEPGACPGIGQQHGGVEHIRSYRGPDDAISHVALLGPCGTARTPSADTAVPGPGPAPLRRNDGYRPDSRACRPSKATLPSLARVRLSA